jgi:F-type H+-transporting ATPase subunit gamma
MAQAKNVQAKAVGFIVVTTDKGLCGGMNTNILRQVTLKLRELEAAGKPRRSGCHRQQGLGFLNRVGAKVVAHATRSATRRTWKS